MEKFSKTLSCFALACFASFAFAKTVNLYDMPNNTAKVIGSIDSEAGFVPIFSTKEGDWVKVGDPRNGSVGWVKSNDLSNMPGFGTSVRVTTTGAGPQSYRIVQISTPAISSEQVQNFMREMQQRQQMIQKDWQKMMQDFFNNTQMTWPVVMPVVVPHPSTPLAPTHPAVAPATTLTPAAPPAAPAKPTKATTPATTLQIEQKQ